MSSASAASKRPYDATRRRERAEQERRATRERVVLAATRLFIAHGYAATTMNDIASAAGVAMQSVYSAGRSKANLLEAAVQRAVAGDDQEIVVHERPGPAAIAAEPDARRQVEMFADLICDIQQRSAPIQVAYREAAAVDAAIAASVADAHRRRLESFGQLLNQLPATRLLHPVQDSIDTVWAVASTEVILLLLNVRHWSWDQIRAWMRRTLVDLLLAD